jgi:hypothetical protein
LSERGLNNPERAMPPSQSSDALAEDFIDRAMAEALLGECVALQEKGEDFDRIFAALLESHDLVNGGKVIAARGESRVCAVPLKGGWILVFDQTAGRWSLDRMSAEMRRS